MACVSAPRGPARRGRSPRAAAACCRRRRGSDPALATASMTRLRAHRPGDAPARVAPVLGEAVEEDDRVAVDVLDVARGALAGGRRAARSRRSASRTRRGAACSRARAPMRTQAASSCRRTTLAGGVARVREAGAPRARGPGSRGADRPPRTRSPRSASSRMGMAMKRLEDVEQLLVGGVVGQEVAEVDRARALAAARVSAARPPPRDADVLGGVLRRQSPPVEAVVERRRSPRAAPTGRRPARTPGRRRRCDTLLHARRRSRAASPVSGCPWPRLHQDGSLRVKPRFWRLGGDVDDAGARHRAEG